MSKLIVHFDGSCEPKNPGGVGTYGWIIDRDGQRVASGSGCNSKGGPGSTNNVSEYAGLGFALRWLADHPGTMQPGDTLVLRGDSKLVVEQLAGRWKCNKEHLQKLKQRCLELLVGFGGQWRTEWIPREQNTEADALSQQAYVTATGKPYPQRRH
jgi:ribonuclease HI